MATKKRNSPSPSSGKLTDGLRALAVSAKNNKSTYEYHTPNPKILESFPAPHGPQGRGSNLTINITVPEFTSLCPLTGQPDFATIKISYSPIDRCVESKALKLYLMGFRQHGEFHEACVQRILRDLVDLLDPEWMNVVGEFTPRGGIPFWPTAHYAKTQFNPLFIPALARTGPVRSRRSMEEAARRI